MPRKSSPPGPVRFSWLLLISPPSHLQGALDQPVRHGGAFYMHLFPHPDRLKISAEALRKRKASRRSCSALNTRKDARTAGHACRNSTLRGLYRPGMSVLRISVSSRDRLGPCAPIQAAWPRNSPGMLRALRRSSLLILMMFLKNSLRILALVLGNLLRACCIHKPHSVKLPVQGN